ncbi:phosphotransferase, partial [Phycicoccus flavus]
MEAALLERAKEAVASVAGDLGLEVENLDVVHSSNTLSLRLLPCDVLVRAAPVGQRVSAFEVAVVQALCQERAPVASLDPRVEGRVHERDGFEMTFWSYLQPTHDAPSPATYADALRRLHAAMRRVELQAPHFTERVTAAADALTDRHRTPTLDDDRSLLLSSLRGGCDALLDRGGPDQLLHGEPHPGNVLHTAN